MIIRNSIPLKVNLWRRKVT